MSEKGIESYVSKRIGYQAVMAHSLAGQFNIGVGIAHGGSFSAFLFERFGLPVIVCNPHGHARGAVCGWFEEEIDSSYFKDKRILIFDNNVKTGKSIGRVVKKLQAFGPESIDLMLTTTPKEENDDYGFDPKKIPPEIRAIYHPGMFAPEEIFHALANLRAASKQ